MKLSPGRLDIIIFLVCVAHTFFFLPCYKSQCTRQKFKKNTLTMHHHALIQRRETPMVIYLIHFTIESTHVSPHRTIKQYQVFIQVTAVNSRMVPGEALTTPKFSHPAIPCILIGPMDGVAPDTWVSLALRRKPRRTKCCNSISMSNRI